MPLYNFIKIICTGELVYLLIDQTQKIPVSIVDTWEKIFEEYVELNKATSAKALQNLQYDIEKLKCKIFAINASLAVLYLTQNKPIIDALAECGLVVDTSTDEKYFKSLVRITSQSKGFSIQLEMKEREVEGMRKNTSNTKVDELFFSKLIQQISKKQGYQVNTKAITVLDFINLQSE